MPSSNGVRPIIIQGHTRPLTMVKYNREGDLLFTAAKDNQPSVWNADNGERIGTYNGHNGTVWCLDVNCAPRTAEHASLSTTPRGVRPLVSVLCCLALLSQSTAHTC